MSDGSGVAVKRSLYWRNLRNWYRRVFWGGEVMQGQVSDAARYVLDDLRRFCRADQSCVVFGKDGQVDTHATAVLEGRREVWLKIVQVLNVSDELLIQMMHVQRPGEYINYLTKEFTDGYTNDE